MIMVAERGGMLQVAWSVSNISALQCIVLCCTACHLGENDS